MSVENCRRKYPYIFLEQQTKRQHGKMLSPSQRVVTEKERKIENKAGLKS